MTTREQIDLWRKSLSEHQRLEFKEAKTQLDNRQLYEHCVALANEGGGLLLLGVSDKPPRAVVGTQAFRDPVAMAEKLFQAIGFRVDIEEVAHPEGRVLVFHIPTRPRGTAYHLDGKYLMRSGEALVPIARTSFAGSSPRVSRTGWRSTRRPVWMRSRWWNRSIRNPCSSCSSCHTRPSALASSTGY